MILLALAAAMAAAPAAAQTSGVRAVATGRQHSCALSLQGQAFCWGANDWGQLGDGTRLSWHAPVRVLGLGPATALAAGDDFTCALTETAEVWCWGDNLTGQLGHGSPALDSPVPVRVTGLGPGVRQISAGGAHACALDQSGRGWCWGANYGGSLGDGTALVRTSPVPVQNLGAGLRQIVAGALHSCALTRRGALACWGDNRHGQLGLGDRRARPRPAPLDRLGDGLSEIAAGQDFSCALRAARRMVCWGRGAEGQLGPGREADSLRPRPQRAMAPGARGLVTAGLTACALDRRRAAFCWGDNRQGQLGPDFAGSHSPAPVAIPGLGAGVQSLSRGTASRHLCAILRDGTLRCWGANEAGQLGIGLITPPQTRPQAVLGRLHRR